MLGMHIILMEIVWRSSEDVMKILTIVSCITCPYLASDEDNKEYWCSLTSEGLDYELLFVEGGIHSECPLEELVDSTNYKKIE